MLHLCTFFLCPTEYDNHKFSNFIMTIDNNKFIVEQPVQPVMFAPAMVVPQSRLHSKARYLAKLPTAPYEATAIIPPLFWCLWLS